MIALSPWWSWAIVIFVALFVVVLALALAKAATKGDRMNPEAKP